MKSNKIISNQFFNESEDEDFILIDWKPIVELFRKAYLKNDAVSQFKLGQYYERDCPELKVLGDYNLKYPYFQAEALYKQSAEQGFIKAIEKLAIFNYEAKEYSEARKQFEKLDQKNSEIQCWIARCYYHEKNYSEAIKWFQESSKGGFAEAQYRVGFMFYFGKGVKKNLTEAHCFFSFAAKQGHQIAKKYVNPNTIYVGR